MQAACHVARNEMSGKSQVRIHAGTPHFVSLQSAFAVLSEAEFVDRFRTPCANWHNRGAPRMPVTRLRPPPAPPIDRDALKAQLRAIAAVDPDVRIEGRFAEGQVARAILDVAKESACDVIVMGTHGRTGLGRLLMGSVAEQVVRHAACPVLTVKTPVPSSLATTL
jgi:nucleotide-binding universal stress UspA family protein